MAKVGEIVFEEEFIELSPFLEIPEGLEVLSDVDYIEPEPLGDDIYVDETFDNDPSNEQTIQPLVPPTNLRIKSQAVRFGPDGRQIVDTIIEWDEVLSADEYEVQYTK